MKLWRKLLSRHCHNSDWLDYATNPSLNPYEEAIAVTCRSRCAVRPRSGYAHQWQQAVSSDAPVDRSGDATQEDPGYLSARRIFLSQGAKLCL